MTMAPLETRHFTPSSTWVSDVSLRDAQHRATLWIAHTDPPLDVEDRFSMERTINIQPQDYEYWNWYLKPGSSLDLFSCAQTGTVDFYVIKGEGNFNNWKEGDHATWQYYARYSSPCTMPGVPYRIDVTAADTYYFVYENPSRTSVPRLHLTFDMLKMEYRTDGLLIKCEATPRCSLPLVASTSIIVQAGQASEPDAGFPVSYHFKPDVVMYGTLFGSLGGVLVCCCVFCAIAKRKKRTAASPTDYSQFNASPGVRVVAQPVVAQPLAAQPVVAQAASTQPWQKMAQPLAQPMGAPQRFQQPVAQPGAQQFQPYDPAAANPQSLPSYAQATHQ